MYGEKNAFIGTIKQSSEFLSSYIPADVDGDGLDEIVGVDYDGQLWLSKYQQSSCQLKSNMFIDAPITAGNLDCNIGDEVILIGPNKIFVKKPSHWSINNLQHHLLRNLDSDDEVENYNIDGIANTVYIAQLTQLNAILPDTFNNNDSSSQKTDEQREEDYEKYCKQFIMPANLNCEYLRNFVAWRLFRPIGYIYYYAKRKCVQLQFPADLELTNAWEDYTVDLPVICKHPGASTSILYCTPMAGTGLLGFEADGKCSYYQEFGAGVSELRTLHTKDGDSLVLRVGNDLLIYP